MADSHPLPSGFRKSFCAVLSVTILGAVGVGAIGGEFNNHHDASQRSPFLYGEIQSIEFDIVYDDHDHDHDHGDSSSTVSGETRRNPLDHRESQQDRGQTPYDSPSSFDFSFSEDVDTECYEDPSSSPSIVASSVLYDGDCNVSVEAMMCHGGGLDNMMDKFIDYDELFDYEDEDGTDDDEDDDDNDGHSSMLSNASLRRSKSTRREKTRRYASSGSTKSDQKQATYVKKVVRLDNMLQLELEQQRCCERKRVHHSFDNFAVPTPLKTVSFIRDQSPKPQNCCSDGLQPAFIVKRKR